MAQETSSSLAEQNGKLAGLLVPPSKPVPGLHGEEIYKLTPLGGAIFSGNQNLFEAIISLYKDHEGKWTCAKVKSSVKCISSSVVCCKVRKGSSPLLPAQCVDS